MRAADAFAVARSLLSLRRSEWWPAERIRVEQSRRLTEALRFAVTRVPYYRRMEMGNLEFVSPDDLSRFPVLTKRAQQENRDALLSDATAASECYVSRTSGSTGEPTTVYFDRDAWLFCKYALKMRRMVSAGVGPGSRVLVVSELSPEQLRGDPVFPGQGLLFGQRRVSIHEPVETALDTLRSFRPHALYAFPSFLAELLEHCESGRLELPHVRAVFTSSEVLTGGLRRRLEESFGGRVHDVYGSTEFKEVAWQCDHGRYHINFESTWVEIDEEVSDDGTGAILLTSLVNRAMPLIRYRVGDYGRLGAGSCDCGRAGPWLEVIGGREVEVLETPDGRRLSPYLLTTVLESDAAMRRYQIVQTGRSALEVRYLTAPGCRVDVPALSRAIGEIVGDAMTIRFRRQQKFERAASGKQGVFVRESTDEHPNSQPADRAEP